ncbi:MAG TPA: hypothetical protein VF952_04210 [Chloroflexia bacterium]|jgi:hypothetical protein
MFDTLLDSRSSFAFAALFVTWVAVLLLMLVIGNLHSRLQRLERAASVSKENTPYANLLGRRLQDLLGESPVVPRVLVFLSSNCTSCARVLNELQHLHLPSNAPLAVAWVDQLPSPAPDIPSNATVLHAGPQISTELGIRVTPFALVAGADGRVLKATPINSLDSLNKLLAVA